METLRIRISETTDWLSHIFQRHVHGFLGGPPCCRFSKARAVALQHDLPGRAPRPVRSDADLWGLASLTLRELHAVLEGNVLLNFCIEAIFALTIIWRQGLLEHPAEPDETDSPSIWNMPIIRLLMTSPGVQRIIFSQGLLGATSKKPTTILAANCPDLPLALRSWHLTPDNPRATTIGKDQGGQFRTAHLKDPPSVWRWLKAPGKLSHQLQLIHWCRCKVARRFPCAMCSFDHFRLRRTYCARLCAESPRMYSARQNMCFAATVSSFYVRAGKNSSYILVPYISIYLSIYLSI